MTKPAKKSKKSLLPKMGASNRITRTIRESEQPAAKPVSLAPLEFEEAMRDLLEVSPDDKRNREGAGGRPQKG